MWDKLTNHKNILYYNQTGLITLPYTGTYEITISFDENHAASAKWSGFGLFGAIDGTAYGTSNGFVTTAYDSSGIWTSYTLPFLATINNINQHYKIQFARVESFTFNSNPDDLGDVDLPSVICIIKYLGQK